MTRFTFESPSRFRELTWRTFSSEKRIVMGFMKAVYDVVTATGREKSCYDELVKDLSRLGSVKILDMMSEEHIYDFVSARYNKYLSDTV